MNPSLQLPSWAMWVIWSVFLLFIALCVMQVKRNHGVKRSTFAMPYTLWMIIFTIIPCLLVGYYAFRDPTTGQFTFEHFVNFWDSNYTVNKMYEEMGPEFAVLIERGTVNIDVLV